MRRPLTLAIVCLFTLLCSLPQVTHAQQPALCFPETGYCIDGPFMDYWKQHGGLPVFGFPLDSAVRDEDGTVFQYFERTVFEYTPQFSPPYHVSLFRMGDIVLQSQGYDWAAEPGESQQYTNCIWFGQTRYNVCNYDGGVGFADYWRTHGLEFDGKSGKSYAESLALFGLPLTEDYVTEDEQGREIIVQWFERARFEWHPHLQGNQRILLGLLGRDYIELDNSGQ